VCGTASGLLPSVAQLLDPLPEEGFDVLNLHCADTSLCLHRIKHPEDSAPSHFESYLAVANRVSQLKLKHLHELENCLCQLLNRDSELVEVLVN